MDSLISFDSLLCLSVALESYIYFEMFSCKITYNSENLTLTVSQLSQYEIIGRNWEINHCLVNNISRPLIYFNFYYLLNTKNNNIILAARFNRLSTKKLQLKYWKFSTYFLVWWTSWINNSKPLQKLIKNNRL